MLKKKTPQILFTIFITLGLASYGLHHFVLYGSPFRNCEYTEKELPVPDLLASGKIIFTQDTQQAIGPNIDYSCLNNLGKILNEIVPPDSINKETVENMYRSAGVELKPVKAFSKEFRVVKVFSVTKHGIGTIDSGSGPIYSLVLKDSDGVLYQIATVMLSENGSQREDDSIAIFRTKDKDYKIDSDNFQDFSKEPAFYFRLDVK